MENETNNVENETTTDITQEENIQDSAVEQVAQQEEISQPDMTNQAPINNEEQPTNMEQTQPMEPILDPKDQKSSNKIMIPIILAVAALAIAGIILIPKLFMSNKKVLENEITTIFASAKETLKNSEKNVLEYDLEKDSLGINGSLTIDSNYKDGDIDLSKLKNYKITYQGAIDKKSNEASAQIGLTKESKNLIDFAGYINGKKVLISLGDIYDKGLTTELEKEIKELEL